MIEQWAVTDPKGDWYPGSNGGTMREAINEFCGLDLPVPAREVAWQISEKIGFQCIQVEMTEVK